MVVLHIDFESRSAVDLKKTGVYVYAEHPSTDLWCVCYAFDDHDVQTWVPGDYIPIDVVDHILEGGILAAHNANFERVFWHHILTPRYGWPEPAVEQWRCTMVMAYALALPGALGDLAPAMRLDQHKDRAGGRLMLQMAKPRKRHDDGTFAWWDEPEKIERLIAYCIEDVKTEREVMRNLRPLSPSELALWHLDQRVNDRGVRVDEPLCVAARALVKRAAASLDAEMAAVTNYAVGACSNVNQIAAYLRERGVDVESIKKDILEDLLLKPDLAPDVRRVIELRREAGKASVSKIDALLKGRSADNRARGLLQFHAASTGRWGGRRFQPQNIVRPAKGFDIRFALDAIAGGYADIWYDDLIFVVSQCLRGLLEAPEGRKLIAVDYKSIESRVLAWLAGEAWKVEAHRKADEGTGPEVYILLAAEILGKSCDAVTPDERQAYGKVPDLALGYQGGVGAFQTMAANYGVNLPDSRVEEIRDGFRAKHSRTKQFWADMEEAAIAAVRAPGSTHLVREILFRMAGSFLFMRLPSKRFLAYPFPAIRPKEMPWVDYNGDPVWKDSLTYFTTIDFAKKRKIVDDPGNSSKWARIATYGGMLAENATQAVARDILADAMPRLEVAGYEVILTVHDEIVAEVNDAFGSVKEMVEIMTDLPAWAEGCPIAAEGWEGKRYRK
jgi:DNA polymerase